MAEVPKTIKNILGQKTLPIAHEKVLLMFKKEMSEQYQLDEEQAKKAYQALKQKHHEDPDYFFPNEGFDAQKAEQTGAEAAGVKKTKSIIFNQGDELLNACHQAETIDDLISEHAKKIQKQNRLEDGFYDVFREICEAENIPDAVKSKFYDLYLSLPPTDLRAKGMLYNNQATLLKKKGRFDQALMNVNKAINLQQRVYSVSRDELDEMYLRMYETNKRTMEDIKAIEEE